MGEVRDKHMPCVDCDSSDAFCVYEDGSGYCFSCKGSWSEGQLKGKGYDGMDSNEQVARADTQGVIQAMAGGKAATLSLSDYDKGRVKAIADRRISAATCKVYGVRVTDRAHYYPTFNSNKEIVGYKTRILPKENFFINGDLSGPDLFGQYTGAGGKMITITEGELDAMAAYQMMGSKYPVVSVKKGTAAALKECKAAFEYLDSFEGIVIAMDNDTAGRAAALQIAQLFPAKARILKLTQHLDPCDYLKAGQDSLFTQEWWRAPIYTADGVLYGEALMKEALKVTPKGVKLLWDSMTGMTGGVRLHEIWTFGAGSGLGKTEWFKEIAYGLISDGHKVGMFMLEEPVSRTVQCMLSKHVNRPIHLEDVSVSQEEYADAIKAVIGVDNLIIYDHKGMSDFENLRDKINYFVTALGVKYIFLDHITAMAEGKSDVEGNVNSRCHYIMEELNKLVQARDCTIFLISHLRKASGTPAEEGGRVHLDDLYGSGAIKQRSNFVFVIEGNTQADDLSVRNLRILRCLKDRNTGRANGMTKLFTYNPETGRIEEGIEDGASDVSSDKGFI